MFSFIEIASWKVNNNLSLGKDRYLQLSGIFMRMERQTVFNAVCVTFVYHESLSCLISEPLSFVLISDHVSSLLRSFFFHA